MSSHALALLQAAFGAQTLVGPDADPDKPPNQYVCDVCGERFAQNSHLITHMWKHMGQESYVCPVCAKGFNRKDNLTVHMRKHTGERPYACDVCGKGFAQEGNLTTHMRTHTPQA